MPSFLELIAWGVTRRAGSSQHQNLEIASSPLSFRILIMQLHESSELDQKLADFAKHFPE